MPLIYSLMKSTSTLLFALLCFWLPVQSSGADLNISTCVDYGCDFPVQIQLSALALDQISARFKYVTTAKEEREQIALAIGEFETLVGQLNGSWRDKGGNPGTVEPLGQLDCIAESQNTTTYLKLLERLGAFRWHRVKERVVRYRYLFAAHWTAVIEEVQSKTEYAVDSWHDDNGSPARITRLEDWFHGEEVKR